MSRRSLNTVGLFLVASVVGGCGSNDAAPVTTTSPTTVAVATTAAPTTTVESTTTTAAPTTTTLPPAYQRVNFVDISTLELGSCVEVVLGNVDLATVSEIEQVWFDASSNIKTTVIRLSTLISDVGLQKTFVLNYIRTMMKSLLI